MRTSLLRSYGEPLDVVEIAEVQDPLVGPDTVLVEMAAAGVNPVDWKVVAGYLQGAFPSHLPMIPGWDIAGTVRAVGPAVTSVKEGDRVAAYARKDHIANGTYAELVGVPDRAIALVPDDVDLVHAGALPLAALTAEQLLETLAVSAGDTVLVHAAAGGVGSFAVQLAGLRGARVIGTASEGNHDYLRGLGVQPVTYGDRLVESVRDLAPNGVDVVIDLVGGDALASTPQLLAEGGRVASIVEADTVKQLGGHYVFVRPDGAMLRMLLTLVSEGKLKVEVAQTFPLKQAGAALETNRSGHTRGKIVITSS